MGSEDRRADECRLCGSTHLVLWGTRAGTQSKDRVFRFYRCKDCDFRFVDPVTGPEIYDDDYYAGRGVDPLLNYESEYTDYTSTPRIEEFRGLAELAEEHLNRAAPARTDPATLRWLDFGCGAGGLLKYLRDRQALTVAGRAVPIEACGFDVGVYAERLRQQDRLRIYEEPELDALPDQSFDVVSLIEVIEHVERPMEVLSFCSRLLRPCGLLLLTTGNLDCPLARWQGVKFGYCIPEIHISLWTPQSLHFAYRTAGLTPRRYRCDGGLRFKITKNLESFDRLKVGGSLWYSRPVVGTLDWLFGVSSMPMAVKPGATVDLHAASATASQDRR